MAEDTRPIGLRVDYVMQRGMLEEVTSQQIKDEIERMKKEVGKPLLEAEKNISEKVERYRRRLRTLEQVDKERDYSRMVNTFELSRDHLKLLTVLHFSMYEDGGDYVFYGVDGKRPFLSSGRIEDDIAEILEWKKPNDDVSDEQYEYAWKLVKELPIAMMEVFKKAYNAWPDL